MHAIDEQTFKILLSSGAVRWIDLSAGTRGFGVFVCIAGDSGAEPTRAMLITSRMKHRTDKKPRTWSSVDSFLDFLKGRAPVKPEIRIQFNQGGDQAENMQHPHHLQHAQHQPA